MTNTRTPLVLLSIALLAMPTGCRKTPSVKSPEAPQEPTAESPEKPAAPAPEKTPVEPEAGEREQADVTATETETQEPAQEHKPNEYLYVGNPNVHYGPAAPPIGKWEKVTAEELAAKWVDVPVTENAGAGPKQFANQEEAAMDVMTVVNRADVAFQVTAMGDWETFQSKFVMEEADYLEFLKSQGWEETSAAYSGLVNHLQGEFEAAQGRYGKFLQPISRQDRIDGMLADGMARLARLHFAYEDRAGTRQEECLLFLRSRLSWQVVDFGCDRAPWERSEDRAGEARAGEAPAGEAPAGEAPAGEADAGEAGE